ncbi:hypothetical protein JKL49_13635 [Phenylobacterium sp. 20VBR1]|uniref:Lipoprotein n=1 Tax=Phenylobacterium glaciei TaxID=2803784 RepID=A0A941D301_9CAUL|nr:hypothetical protein [Phenylobacterium glaciei]MBR7620429.1 hypothetical protein [Phenylobacterium glaciei]
MKTILSLLAALTLSGCASLTPEQGVKLGVDLYCATLTDAGKQVIRDRVTAGTRVLACPTGAEPARP